VVDLCPSEPSPALVGSSAGYLIARLRIVESRVRALVAERRQDDPSPDDPFLGLYLSDDHVDRMLSGSVSPGNDRAHDSLVAALEEEARQAEAAGASNRLQDLAGRAGLDELDVELLLVALVPDVDSRFERLYGYLNDDVTRRRATVGLGLELCGASAWSGEARSRVSSDAPLIRSGLILVEEPERPFLSRSLRVPDRVAAYLLGDDRPDPLVTPLIRSDVIAQTEGVAIPLGKVLAGGGVRLVYLRERPGGSGPAIAAAALTPAGYGVLPIDLDHLNPDTELETAVKAIGREALLSAAAVVAGPIEALLDRGPSAVRAFAALPGPVLLHGRASWEPGWSRLVPLVVDTLVGSSAERRDRWEKSLGADAPAGLCDADVATQFLLSGDQVARAVESARLQARLAGVDVDLEHLRAGARAQNGAGLERLARRIQPGVSWRDLVLASPTAEALRELAARARRRELVLDTWNMRPGGGRGRGITVLFAGDSGTGKTMSAEVVAGDLGLDLYAVNLATVVDKYVGETEKNLERIFAEADGVNAVLLFDEADALFGKRSEVRDANDRYANIEVGYLLQRMETFDGLAILATNLRANVDDAFVRRLDMIVDFPAPDAELRRVLWDRCLAPDVPRDLDLDLDFCARAFELAGGNIRSIALTAAYLAADSGRPVAMADLIRAVHREYRKLGRMVVASEFGDYYPLTSSS
jgi:hypothetical protein